MNKLSEALSVQRANLAQLLLNNDHPLFPKIIQLLKSEGILPTEEEEATMLRLFTLARLLDNLLDEQNVNPSYLINEISDTSAIGELTTFIEKLPSDLRSDFIRYGKLVIRLSASYERGKSVGYRILEAKALLKLNLSVLSTKSKQALTKDNEKKLENLFIMAYMICDLGDFCKDKNRLGNLPRLIGILLDSGGKYFSIMIRTKMRHILG